MICTLLGDGDAKIAAEVRPECRVVAQAGASSAEIIVLADKVRYGGVTVISAGGNDPWGDDTESNLRQIRYRVRGGEVVWLLPISGRVTQMIRRIAREQGDRVIEWGDLETVGFRA